MRFIPINLDTVKNAAMLYSDILSKEPWNVPWTYTTAYARLHAEVKKVGFAGYIVLEDDGSVGGFLMGHTEYTAEGAFAFKLTDICFSATVHGNELAQGALKELTDELKRRNINRIVVSAEYSRLVEAFYTMLGFKPVDKVLTMMKTF